MKIEKLIIGAILLITTSTRLLAQDYFIAKGDTTYCSHLEFSRNMLGYLKSIKYTDVKGQSVSIEDKNLLLDVETFYQDSLGITTDKTPVKAHKPDGYIRYTARKVDGKLKIYLVEPHQSNAMTYNSHAMTPGWQSTGYIGPYLFFIKMPDGTYYKINSAANMKKYIKPYLLQCPLFAKKYQGDFSRKQEIFIEMIKLYNSLCD